MNNVYGDIKLASSGKRLGAFLIDNFMQVIATLVTIFFALMIFGLDNEFRLFIFFVMFFLSLIFINFIIPIFIWNGQTIGKRILKIKVVSENGEELEGVKLLGRILILNLSSSMFYGVPLIISGILVLSNDDRQSLHDKIFNTIVIDTN